MKAFRQAFRLKIGEKPQIGLLKQCEYLFCGQIHPSRALSGIQRRRDRGALSVLQREDFFLHGVPCNQLVGGHHAVLSDPVGSGRGLGCHKQFLGSKQLSGIKFPHLEKIPPLSEAMAQAQGLCQFG